VTAEAGLALTFRPEVIEAGQEFLRTSGIDDASFIFVHSRKGDYQSWPSQAFPAVLPTAWLIKQANEVRRNRLTDACVILGDDRDDKTSLAASLAAHVSEESAAVDLWLMSRSVGGVLSPSTFSWWGAAFAAHRDPSTGPFFAPTFWAGHRSRQWMPA
jgi:hypothetical protein